MRRPIATLCFASLVTGVVAFRAQAPDAPSLNHLYLVVDSASYDAIAAEPLLRDTLRASRESEVSDGRDRWRALYIFGRRTYLELYREAPGTPPVGTVGLAMGFDERQRFETFATRLIRSQPGRFIESTRHRVVGADTIAWFSQIAPSDHTPPLRWWMMAYDPDHIRRRWPAAGAAAGVTTRHAYLDAAGTSTPSMGDVSALHWDVADSLSQAHIAAQLRTAGFVLEQDGARVTARARDFHIIVDWVAAGAEVGVRSVSFADARGARSVRVRAAFGVAAQDDGRLEFGPGSRCRFEDITVATSAGLLHACASGPADAPLVLLESGLGEGIGAFDELQAATRTTLRLVSYDRRRPAGAEPDIVVRLHAETARRLLNGLAPRGTAVFVGHSLGGTLAQAYARERPQDVAALLLVDPTPDGFADRQAEILGPVRWATYDANARANLRGRALAEWNAIPAITAASRGLAERWHGPTVILTSGLVQYPDTAVGRQFKAAWIELHRMNAQALSARHRVLPGIGHRIQRDSPATVEASLRELVAQGATRR